MTQVPHEAPVKRILVAMEATTQNLDVVELAAALAAALKMPLHGLFVEDINLLRLAALPFAREIGQASATALPLEWAEMERFIRRQSVLAERLLENAAKRLQIDWTFQVTRGLPLIASLSHIGERELLVLGAAATASGPVMLLFDGSPASLQALPVAAQLAYLRDKPLTILFSQPLNAAKRHAIEQAVQSVALNFQQVPDTTPQRLAQAAKHAKASLLVVAAASAPGEKDIQVLVNRLECPLALVA